MIRKIFEELAPVNLALDNDPVGLQIGSWNSPITKILVTLDVNQHVVDEAIANGADMIFSHHAPLYRPIAKLLTDTDQGRMLQKLLVHNISVYAAHTNLDIVAGGVNDVLAGALGLDQIDILKTTQADILKKLVVFVPRSHHQQVLEAMAAAGAGFIGNYSHCTFNTDGVGTFMPLADSNPYIGEQNRMERVEEVRLETIVDQRIEQKVIDAMKAAHPYEEVAYDIYRLDLSGKEYGLGRIGRYSEPLSVDDFLRRVKTSLSLSSLQITNHDRTAIQTVAVCGGSGSRLIADALCHKADAYITGDITYHDAQYAAERGLLLVNAGHYQTERLIVPAIAKRLTEAITSCQLPIEVIASQVSTDPFQII